MSQQTCKVIEIIHLERLALRLVTKGFGLVEISRRTRLSKKSVKKLLDNVSRKIRSITEERRV
jgi:DNA-binding CsgD family transcriptional regulator